MEWGECEKDVDVLLGKVREIQGIRTEISTESVE